MKKKNINTKQNLKKNYIFYFWADTEKKIGLGHLNRLKSVSEEFKKYGLNAKFVTKSNLISKKLISNNNIFLPKYISHYVKNHKIPKKIFYKNKKHKIIFIDSYKVNNNFFKKLKQSNFKIIYFNDFKKKNNADLNICLGSKVINKKYLSGFDYIPLSKEYSKPKKNLLNKNTLLITLGSSDPKKLTLKIVRKLLKFNLNLIVIIGKYYDEEIPKKLLKFNSKKIRLIYQPKNLFEYFRNSDSVICAGGLTVFESLSLGIPTICLELCENQTVNILNLKKFKLIKSINLKFKKNINFRKELLDVMFDKKYRLMISNKSIKMVNKNGSHNILKQIIKRF